jgi:phosphoenolpyruvate carboxykinase (GTP)
MKTIARNALFTNCALTEDVDVWWEEMTRPAPDSLVDWTRRPWNAKSRRKAAHPNARFTVPARQCPVIAPEWENPAGVPISAILFGGRRATVVPLVIEALSWQHGVFLGSVMASETTAAAAGRPARCAATRWPCSPSAATTWAITSGTGWRLGRGQTHQICRGFFT